MKKSTLRICLIVIAVCLVIPLIYVLCNQSSSREATAAEIAEANAYLVDWSGKEGWQEGMTEKEYILSLCSHDRDETSGDVTQSYYVSDVLHTHLHRFGRWAEVMERRGYLYVCYLTEDDDQVILAYDDEGIYEICIYDGETDTMYHMIEGTSVVWSKFRNGFQFGN